MWLRATYVRFYRLLVVLLHIIMYRGFPRTVAGMCHWRAPTLVARFSDSTEGCGVCPKAPNCSGEYLSRGCIGNGKIQGGIGVYLSWWPIKVYRPCPAFVAAGYNYKREGQTLEQVLFSEPSAKMKLRMKKLKNERAKDSSSKLSDDGKDIVE